MSTLTRRARNLMGRCLLRHALKLLDPRSGEWQGAARGLREQRLYERYVAYTEFARALYSRDGKLLSKGRAPLCIQRWREQRKWIDQKFANRRVEDYGSTVLLS